MTTTSPARRPGRTNRPSFYSGQRPADFDAAACPIIARHWFGAEPLRPIGAIIPPVIRRFESLREAADASA